MILTKKILIVVGTRPNFIKVTQFKKEAKKFPSLEIKIVHTGQHYDEKMSDVFFKQFNLIPDYFLNISNTSAIVQMSEIMVKLEHLINTTYKPDLMIVVGDVNSTFAAALVSNKLNIKLAHLESGLRSFDKTMPEEHNRVLTDSITDYFFVTEESAIINLSNEGREKKKIFFCGNTMIDTLVAFKQSIKNSKILKQLKINSKEFVLMTMHRPSTVDSISELKKLVELIEMITIDSKLVFPIHPRTLKNIENSEMKLKFQSNKNLIITPPLDYFAFQNLILNCKFIITDSGGIQEESTFLKVPCLTLRPNTERPVTCTIGTNTLIPFDLKVINKHIKIINAGKYKAGFIPRFWNGNSTKKIVQILSKLKL